MFFWFSIFFCSPWSDSWYSILFCCLQTFSLLCILLQGLIFWSFPFIFGFLCCCIACWWIWVPNKSLRKSLGSFSFLLVYHPILLRRDTIEFIGQDRNPTQIFTCGGQNVTVHRLVELAHSCWCIRILQCYENFAEFSCVNKKWKSHSCNRHRD